MKLNGNAARRLAAAAITCTAILLPAAPASARLGCHDGLTRLRGVAGPPGDCLRGQQQLGHGDADPDRH